MFDTVVQMLPEALLCSTIAEGDYRDALLLFKVNACESCLVRILSMMGMVL